MEESRTLESPVVQEAKRRYESSKMFRLHKLPFDELFDAYASDMRLEEIGKRFGIPMKKASYIRVRFFDGICGFGGVARRRARQTARWRQQVECLEDATAKGSPISIIAQKAREAGCSVQILPRRRGGPGGVLLTRSHLIGINGRICSVKVARTMSGAVAIARSANDEAHAHIVLALRGSEIRIALVPSTIVHEARFANSQRASTTLHFKWGARSSCSYTELCLRGFENAWWVVGQLFSPARSA